MGWAILSRPRMSNGTSSSCDADGQTSGTVGSPEDPRPSPLPVAASWAVVHTKARAEKVLARFLADQGVPHYLPQVLSVRRYGARHRESWIPLFPGYVFFDPTRILRPHVFGTRKVAGILVPDDPVPLRTDLENLASALQREPGFRRHVPSEPGSPVEVVAGPLRGTRGRLVRQGQQSKLVVMVDFIGFGAEVEIEESVLAPAA